MDNVKLIEPGFYYYQCEDYATIKLNFRFHYKPSKKNCLIASILSEYLYKSNGKYNTLKKINNKIRDLYGADYNVESCHTGKEYYIVFSYSMLDPKLIGDNYFKKAIKFFKEIMFNPLFIDNKLDAKLISKMKQARYDNYKESNIDPASIQFDEFLRNIVPKSDMVKYGAKSLSEYTKLLNEITDEDVINFYHELFNNYSRGGVFGNLTDKEMQYIADNFKFKSSTLHADYNHYEEVSPGEKEIVNKDTTQSYLYMTYSIKDYNYENDHVCYDAIYNMLNSSMSGLVLKVLREELGLVYSAYADFYNRRGIIYIEASIDKKNKEKCIEGINEIFKRLHNKEIVTKLLKYHIDKYNEYNYTFRELIDFHLYNLASYVYKIDIGAEEELELINKLTTEDIIKAVNRMELKNTFFFRGDK